MSSPWSLEDRSTRAVEVVTTLGDTVLDVKHYTDPRGGKVKPATWVAFGFGAACLLASAIAFAVSLADAASDRDRLDAHLLATRPAWAFHPTARGLGFDLFMLGGLYAGLASLAIGLVRLPRERTSPGYRIGTAPGVDQPVASAPSADFPLVAPFGDDFVINVGAGIECAWIEDGVETPLAELYDVGFARDSVSVPGVIELPIPTSGRIRARCGHATFFVTSVARPRVESLPIWRIEGRPLAYVAVSLALHVWVLHFPPLDPELPLEVCEIERADVVARIVDTELDNGADDCPHLVSMGCVVTCVERAWPEEETREPRDPSPRYGRDPILAREQAVEMARYVLLEPSTDAESPPPLPRLVIGLPMVQGDLDRWIIRRRIKNHYNELAACYQRELIAKPWLEGVAGVELLIETDGTVVTTRGYAMDAQVAGCLASVVKEIRFPYPNGGGRVQVNYPFSFHAPP